MHFTALKVHFEKVKMGWNSFWRKNIFFNLPAPVHDLYKPSFLWYCDALIFFYIPIKGLKKKNASTKKTLWKVLMRIKHINSEMAYIPILDVYPKYWGVIPESINLFELSTICIRWKLFQYMLWSKVCRTV